MEHDSHGPDSFWKVEDSNGRDYGTFDRLTAADVSEQVKRENDAIGYWVGISIVETAGTCH
ncbi:hypothetical protein [Caballeronia sordidicola]|uniref:Uncharacterized protein n=1 Tax=Caballeronia sordidicola TaxID=196367 RepID=A0A242MN06_CABSO|nr:hypothetical protein [Caballeronia sordidicola]OTP72372.1 hypothetical protein PAMC26510_21335 [Caballeronia sordidicola]